MSRRLLVWVVVVFCTFFAACAPTTEGEAKRWAEYEKNYSEYAATYPGFKKALDAQMKKAKKVWDSAAKISEPEKKAEKMAQANDILDELDDEFEDYEDVVRSLKSKNSKLSGMKVSSINRNLRKSTVKDSEGYISKSHKRLKAAKPKSAKEAIDLLDDETRDLEKQVRHIEKMIETMSPPKKDKKKKKS